MVSSGFPLGGKQAEERGTEIPLEVIAAKPRTGRRLVARGENATGFSDMEVDRQAIQDEVMRSCGDLPSSVQGRIYAEIVFGERYGTHVDNEPDRHDD
jgi:hypothetical protein